MPFQDLLVIIFGTRRSMCLSQLPLFLIFLCLCFCHDLKLFASVATPVDINRCNNFECNLGVPGLLSPPQVYTASIPKQQKAVPTTGLAKTFATYVIVVITVLNIIVYKLGQYLEEDYHERNIQSPSSFEKQWRLFSISEIRLATHNFGEDLVLGKGGFGKVYKGLLNDGAVNTVAVKRLNSNSRQGAKEFWTEIEMLSNFQHSHLVSLIGYCNEEREMILVYEYMPHGTLSDHLYKKSRHGPVVPQPLSWEQRLKICIGAARGLDYLHTGTGLQQRVIHRDVKSSNILLDEHWEAKVSDFGLSKIGPANQSCSHVSTNVKGTFGYLDPEYFLTHRLTRKSDVYAFGVVLFEVLCGRPAVDMRIDEDQQALARYAHRCIQEGTIHQIIDSNLRGQISEDCLKVFAEIGDQCLHYEQNKRPTMANVVAKLEFAMELQKRESSVDYVFLMDPGRLLDNQEGNDTAGVLGNLEDNIGGVLGNLEDNIGGVLGDQEDDTGGILDNQGNFPSSKKKDKGMLKLFTRKMFKAILVVTKGKKNIARKKTGYSSSSSLHRSFSEETQIRDFSFLKIQAATNSFDAGLVLTYGRRGMVFKGYLDRDRTEVAIKKLLLTSQRRGYESFRSENFLHTKINHLHVLPLIGFCCDDINELYLVSKYMSNGSLEHHLHNNNNNSPLTWNLRLQICIGVAKGLNYLHTGIVDQIITHGGMKPNKILLDENWIPKVSGYGLWKIETPTKVSAYMSPEQKAQEPLTTKSDVYSMGVVLLNVLFDWRHMIMTLVFQNKAEVSLSAWVKRNIRRRTLVSFIDPYLFGKVASECFIEILDTALDCLMKDKYKRPSMEDVVKRLESALELQTNHTWSFSDDVVKELEYAFQNQLQTNHNWSLDDDNHTGMSRRDDVEMNSWSSILSHCNTKGENEK